MGISIGNKANSHKSRALSTINVLSNCTLKLYYQTVLENGTRELSSRTVLSNGCKLKQSYAQVLKSLIKLKLRPFL